MVVLAWLETANAGIMSDFDEQNDLEAARLAMSRERAYTLGWRAYLAGRKRPTLADAGRGYDDAKHAHEVCGRRIAWSLLESTTRQIVNELYGR